jgi:hypothetical protein
MKETSNGTRLSDPLSAVAPTERTREVSSKRWRPIVWGCALFVITGYLACGAYEDLRLARLVQAPASSDKTKTIYDGIEFSTVRDLTVYLADSRRNLFYPWARYLHEWMGVTLISAACGLFGGILNDVFRAVKEPSKKVVPTFGLGLLMGPTMIGISALYPALVMEGEFRFRLPAVVGVSLLAGCFSSSAWGFLSHLAGKTFDKQ